MFNDLKLIASNNRFSYYTYNYYLNDFKHFNIRKLDIHCIFDKKKKKVFSYISDFKNKFQKILEIPNVSEESIEKTLKSKKNKFKTIILTILLTSVLTTSAFGSSFSINSDNITIDIGQTSIERNIKEGVDNAYSIINKNDFKETINTTHNNDIDILISSDYGKINTEEELKKLFEKLNLNSDTIDKIKFNNEIFTAFTIPGKYTNDEKNKIIVLLNKNFLKTSLMSKTEEKAFIDFLTNILVHEMTHAKFNGGENEAVLSQIFTNNLNENSKIMDMIFQFSKTNEINSINDISNILKMTNFENQEFQKMKYVVINDNDNYINDLEHNKNKSDILKKFQPDRGNINGSRVSSTEYAQIFAPIEELQNMIEDTPMMGGYIFNITKSLVDNGYNGKEVYDFTKKLNESKWMENIITNLMLVKKENRESMNKNVHTMINMLITNSILTFDKKPETKIFLENKLNEESGFFTSKINIDDKNKIFYSYQNKFNKTYDTSINNLNLNTNITLN